MLRGRRILGDPLSLPDIGGTRAWLLIVHRQGSRTSSASFTPCSNRRISGFEAYYFRSSPGCRLATTLCDVRCAHEIIRTSNGGEYSAVARRCQRKLARNFGNTWHIPEWIPATVIEGTFETAAVERGSPYASSEHQVIMRPSAVHVSPPLVRCRSLETFGELDRCADAIVMVGQPTSRYFQHVCHR